MVLALLRQGLILVQGDDGSLGDLKTIAIVNRQRLTRSAHVFCNVCDDIRNWAGPIYLIARIENSCAHKLTFAPAAVESTQESSEHREPQRPAPDKNYFFLGATGLSRYPVRDPN